MRLILQTNAVHVENEKAPPNRKSTDDIQNVVNKRSPYSLKNSIATLSRISNPCSTPTLWFRWAWPLLTAPRRAHAPEA